MSHAQNAVFTVLLSLCASFLAYMLSLSTGAGTVVNVTVGIVEFAFSTTLGFVCYHGVAVVKSFIVSHYKRWVTVGNVAALVVGLFCGGVSGGIALAVGANMIIVAVFAVAGFAGYARLAHNTFLGTTQVSDLFDFRR